MNLKKLNKYLLLFSILSVLFSCSSRDNNSNKKGIIPFNKGFEESEEISEFINIKDIKVNSYLYSPKNLFNASGMSGNYGYNHVHSSSSPRDNMFLTSEKEMIIEFDSYIQVGHLYIWNYNSFKYNDSSLKSFNIEYSLDGEEFYKLNEEIYTLSKFEGREDEEHSLINNNDYIDLCGVSTKYLKINFLSNYGGIYYGLSEIRMYKYQPTIKEGNEVVASLLDNDNVNKNYSSLCSSLALNKMNSLDGLASSNKDLMYSSKRKELTFYFDGNYPLSKIGIWNYNDLSSLNDGIKKLEILTSVNGYDYVSQGIFSISKSQGNELEKVSSVISLDNVSCQFVRFKFIENYGGDNFGLTGIKFILGKGKVTKESVYYSSLFSSYSGWTGSDGIFGVSLDNDQSISKERDTLFNFSDTYIGKVDQITKHRKDYTFKNNSFGYYKNHKMEFVLDNEQISTEKMLDRSSSDAFCWLGDSFVANNKYYVSRLYIAKEGPLGFTQKGEDLVSFDIVSNKIDFNSKKEIIDKTTNKLSYFSSNKTIIFGSAIFENTVSSKALNPDGYIYNFGYKDENGKRELVCCRVKEDKIEDFSSYQYLSSSSWSDSILDVKGLIDHVSCEMSVSEINDVNSPYYGQFLLTYQKDTIGNEIQIARTSSFQDGFSSVETIYACKEKMFMDGISFYNAKMHPTLSSYSRYVISYNLNESGSNLNVVNGDIYHPRFIELFQI